MLAPNANSFGFFATTTPSLSFADEPAIRSAILDVYFIFTNPTERAEEPLSFQAVEILFYACIKRYTVGVKDGQASTEVNPVPLTIQSSTLTATALSIQWNARAWSCIQALQDPTCNDLRWGVLELGASNASEPGDAFIVHEKQGFIISMLLLNQMGNQIDQGGQFIGQLGGGLTFIHRNLGDYAFPLGVMLWPRNLLPEPIRPPHQFQILHRFMNNIAKSVDNL
jgi:hypothetical protein